VRAGRAKSLDLRERVVAAYETGRYTYAEVAQLFGVGHATVNRYLRLKRETGSVARRPHGGGQKPRLSEVERKRLRSLVERHPDWTTFEFLDAVNAKRTKPVSRSTIVRALAALGFTRKKSPWSPRSVAPTASKNGVAGTSKRSRPSDPIVWFIWTKPASRSR
jgi:transposase